MSSPKGDHDLIFPAFTLSQAKDAIFELYDAWKPGGAAVPIAHQVNDVTGILHYAGSVAAPDDDHDPATVTDDPKMQFVALVAPLREARTAGAEDDRRINWRALAKLLIQVLPLILPLFLKSEK